MGSEYHVPVCLTEVIEALNLEPGQTVVDATLGGGGHALEIAKKIAGGGKTGRLLGCDKDAEAYEHCQNLFEGEKIKGLETLFWNCDFTGLCERMRSEGIGQADAILADLGVSSHQIDEPERGFSYTHDGPLDMRMDREQKLTADSVVNGYSRADLERIIKDFGEERYHSRVAEAIIKARPIKSTLHLAKVIQAAVPGNYFKTGGHPAKRTFQAIRIEVNGELRRIEPFITEAVKLLKPGGRIVIITFHSLEDRIVKQTFKHLAAECVCPPKTPVCICGHRASLKIITKKPVEAGENEKKANPRSLSAKLRAAEKI